MPIIEIISLIGIALLTIERIISKISIRNIFSFCCNKEIIIDKNDQKQGSNCYKFTESN